LHEKGSDAGPLGRVACEASSHNAPPPQTVLAPVVRGDIISSRYLRALININFSVCAPC